MAYMSSIKAPDVVQNRAMHFIDIYWDLLAVELIECFVCEVIKEDEERLYQSLWFISTDAIMEVKNFIQDDHFDYIKYKENILWWDLSAKDFDFKNATAASRLSIDIQHGGKIAGHLSASGINCMHLFHILREIIQPNTMRM
jgi:hypothetical protein